MRCEICGMGIMKGGKGNFVIELKDGSTRITDSPDCGILLRGNLADNVKAIKATDYDKKELINADSAYYVKGADITTKKDRLEKGLMPNSMVAFSTKEAAEAFQKEHGGSVLNYEEAVKSLAGKKMKKQGYDKDKGHGM
jgi:nitrous oxide reductase accessory protein NosL